MQTEKKEFEDIGAFFGAVLAKATMTKFKTMAAHKDKHAQIWKDAMMPFINPHNISLFLNDKNIDFVRNAIVEKVLPALDKNYFLLLQTTAEKKDICVKVYSRPEPTDQNTKVQPVEEWEGFMSQLNQEKIFTLIHKFLPNAGTEQPQ